MEHEWDRETSRWQFRSSQHILRKTLRTNNDGYAVSTSVRPSQDSLQYLRPSSQTSTFRFTPLESATLIFGDAGIET